MAHITPAGVVAVLVDVARFDMRSLAAAASNAAGAGGASSGDSDSDSQSSRGLSSFGSDVQSVASGGSGHHNHHSGSASAEGGHGGGDMPSPDRTSGGDLAVETMEERAAKLEDASLGSFDADEYGHASDVDVR